MRNNLRVCRLVGQLRPPTLQDKEVRACMHALQTSHVSLGRTPLGEREGTEGTLAQTSGTITIHSFHMMTKCAIKHCSQVAKIPCTSDTSDGSLK